MPLRSSRPSAFMSLPAAPFSFVSELMLFDFSPFMPGFMSSCARWFLAAPGCIFSSDWVDFLEPLSAPLGSEALSRFIGAADGAPRSDDGALCWTVEPADGASRLVPVPCALANPVPAISAAAATEIIKRLVMELSPHVFALPAPTTKADVRCSLIIAVPSGLFLRMPDEMNPWL